MTTTRSKYRARLTPYFWLLPAVVIVAFSTIYPIVYSVDLSLWETTVFAKDKYAGLGNYKAILSDSHFWAALLRSLVFTIGGCIITYAIGLLLAFMLKAQTRANTVYRTLILIPWITNEVVFGLMWLWLLNPEMSPLYSVSETFGISVPDLLGNSQYALLTLTIINGIRAVGFSLVMLLAGLTAVPPELEEAAALDGCSKYQQLKFITMPLLKPVSLVTIIVLTISYINIIGFFQIVTNGGPGKSTEVLSIYLYKNAFTYFNLGFAAALTVIVLVINLGLAWIYKRAIGSEDAT